MEAHDAIDALKRQLQEADIHTPQRKPWIPEEREDIIHLARQCLGLRDEWIPHIEPRIAGATSHGEVTIKKLTAMSWTRCFCAAHLYAPKGVRSHPLPLVLLCCGHGKGGKQAEGYRRMAWRLACQGCAVLVPDNIGQGDTELFDRAS